MTQYSVCFLAYHDFKVSYIRWLNFCWSKHFISLCLSFLVLAVLFFVGYKFRHLRNISSLFNDEIFTEKVLSFLQ